MTRIFEVTNDIYISSEITDEDVRGIRGSGGVNTIINLMLEVTYDPQGIIRLIHIPIRDGERIPKEKLTEIYNAIDTYKSNGILIHCAAGVSRSAGVIIGQLMRENPKWHWGEAENYLRKIKPVIPDLNIRDSIINYIANIKRL